MVFPGQGSQSAGMLDGYGDMPAIRETLAEASEVLKQDLAKLIAEGPAEELNSTVNTQPVMVTAGICAWRAWRESGGADPALLAGHSLGEYTALVVAGAISFADCLPLVRLRGRAMQEAVRSACAEAAEGDVCEAVNFNAPGQVVIAGHAAAVGRAIEGAKARGAKRAMALPVSAPFHSSLMAPAAARLREALERVAVNSPRIPVIHNVDAKSHTDASGVKEALVTQADHPVRWVECVREMAAKGVKQIFECGPGKVLAPLVRRTAEGLQGVALADRAGLEQGAQLSKAA